MPHGDGVANRRTGGARGGNGSRKQLNDRVGHWSLGPVHLDRDAIERGDGEWLVDREVMSGSFAIKASQVMIFED